MMMKKYKKKKKRGFISNIDEASLFRNWIIDSAGYRSRVFN